MRSMLIATVVIGVAVGTCFWAYRSGTLQFNRPSPARYPITGLDVSHHQGDVDWSEVASAGASFAFIKASEGGDFVDAKFDRNWRSARAAGLAAGPYHFFTFCSAGVQQAEHFLKTAPPSEDSLPPVVDVEFVGNCRTWTDLVSVRTELARFIAEVERAWGIRPILYTTPDALERVVGDVCSDCPIWIRSVFWEPAPEAYRRWRIWQFSDNSRFLGIQGPVDRNALRPGSTLKDLRVPAAQQGAAADAAPVLVDGGAW